LRNKRLACIGVHPQMFHLAKIVEGSEWRMDWVIEDVHDRKRITDIVTRDFPHVAVLEKADGPYQMAVTDGEMEFDEISAVSLSSFPKDEKDAVLNILPTVEGHFLAEYYIQDEERLHDFYRFVAAHHLKEAPAPCRDGLLFNNMMVRLIHRIEELLLSGARVDQLDDAARLAGASHSLLETMDRIGIDYYLAMRKRLLPDVQGILIDRMVAEGRFGPSVGVGWCRYPGGGGPVDDPLIQDMVDEEAHFAGIERRTMSEEEIAVSLMRTLDAIMCDDADEGRSYGILTRVFGWDLVDAKQEVKNMFDQ
jgi:hypothetical protein